MHARVYIYHYKNTQLRIKNLASCLVSVMIHKVFFWSDAFHSPIQYVVHETNVIRQVGPRPLHVN